MNSTPKHFERHAFGQRAGLSSRLVKQGDDRAVSVDGNAARRTCAEFVVESL
jgi:hypothetical protein